MPVSAHKDLRKLETSDRAWLQTWWVMQLGLRVSRHSLRQERLMSIQNHLTPTISIFIYIYYPVGPFVIYI